MSAVVTGAGAAFPPLQQAQAELFETYFRAHAGRSARVAERVWRNTGIERRSGAVDPRVEDVAQWGTAQRMERYVTEAMPLGRDAIAKALADAGLDAADVGLLTVVSCTGYSTPGLDIRLADELGMAADVQRLFIGHMGCYAALPGLGAVSDFVAARGRPAVMLCLELTSLHVQPPTADLQQIVAHSLFGDAAAAVVVQADAATGWEVVDTAAVTDASTSALMTWDVTDTGFRMGLSPKVPAVLQRHARPAVEALLDRHGLAVTDIAGWAVHPGSARIVEVIAEQLGLDRTAVQASFDVLADRGNCSSATVLLVLARVQVDPGGYAVAMAFGPGLTLYSTLLRRR